MDVQNVPLSCEKSVVTVVFIVLSLIKKQVSCLWLIREPEHNTYLLFMFMFSEGKEEGGKKNGAATERFIFSNSRPT
jgi:hypothetical protein